MSFTSRRTSERPIDSRLADTLHVVPLQSHTAKLHDVRQPHLTTVLPVWLSSNAMVVITKVTLRQARLILGWVHHLGM